MCINKSMSKNVMHVMKIYVRIRWKNIDEIWFKLEIVRKCLIFLLIKKFVKNILYIGDALWKIDFLAR